MTEVTSVKRNRKTCRAMHYANGFLKPASQPLFGLENVTCKCSIPPLAMQMLTHHVVCLENEA